MQYTLDDRGQAENGLMEALAAIYGAKPSLGRMALAGDPRAFVALSLARAGEGLLLKANETLNPITNKAA